MEAGIGLDDLRVLLQPAAALSLDLFPAGFWYEITLGRVEGDKEE